jgi:hypothetical protein
LTASWREQQRLQREFLNSGEAERIDWQVIWVSITAALTMTLQYYGGTAGRFVYDALVSHGSRRIVFTASPLGCRSDVLVCPGPVAHDPFPPGAAAERIRLACTRYLGEHLDLSGDVRADGSGDPVVQRDNLVSSRPIPSIARSGEPFWLRMIVWQLLYALQFVALEFFFRGYLIHGWKRRLGPYAIFAAMVPYCLIHFGKPLPETLGSIVAGVVLGLMSLKTNSIWPGAGLHIAVAWTMDAAATTTDCIRSVLRRGRLRPWWDS